MPQTKPSSLNVSAKLDSESFRRDLLRSLNYIINDLYGWLDKARGLGDKSLDSISSHAHTSPAEGGDYPWADITASQVAYLVALQAAITVSNLLDKSANEEISGTYKLTALTANSLLSLNASKEIESLTEQASIADAETAHTITDFTDTKNALDALGAKINAILSVLDTANITT